jgi:hypothetical protein
LPKFEASYGSKAALALVVFSLPRRFFLATSFSSGWLGTQATFRIRKIPIKNRPEWWGRRPSLLQWKGGIAVSQPLLYNYLSPNMITNEDRELRR